MSCGRIYTYLGCGRCSLSAEENKTTHRRFYEEIVNQKHLAVVDEIADATKVSIKGRDMHETRHHS